jgi:adenylate kinase
MRINTYIFMGKPGAGKGMQSELLSEALGSRVFSTGGRFRELAREDSLLGHKVKEVIESGALTPHWLASYLFETALFEDGNGIIFEGAGRTIEEARLFTEVSAWLGSDFRVLFLNASDKTVEKRLALRAEIESRADDKPEKILYRIDNFMKETMPAVEYFRSQGKVIDIDGEPLPDAVHKEVLEKLAPYIHDQA